MSGSGREGHLKRSEFTGSQGRRRETCGQLQGSTIRDILLACMTHANRKDRRQVKIIPEELWELRSSVTNANREYDR